MALLILPGEGNNKGTKPVKLLTGSVPSYTLKAPMLERNDLHVWSADLDETIHCAEALLSGQEIDKAARFKFTLHRQRFIHGRAILRILLGHYLGKAAQDVEIHYGPAGKPMVDSALSFNLAHSGQMAVFGFTFDGTLGIDVERVHAMPEIGGVAKIFFSDQEYNTWKNLPEDLQEIAFFNCWTRKEAFVKAVGVGISDLLKDFVVAFEPSAEAALTHLEAKHGQRDCWRMISFEPASGYVGAAAVANREIKVSNWHFQLSQSQAESLVS